MLKHYVINLKKRPERLDFWRGYMAAFDFPIGNDHTRVIEAVDKDDFQNHAELFAYARELGFDWEYTPHPVWERLSTGYTALRLTHDILLREIAYLPEGEYHCIWLDDQVLNMDYENFESYVGQFKSDPAVQVVSMHLEPFVDLDETEKTPVNKRWLDRNLYRHPSLPLYRGCVGTMYNTCMVVTSAGGARLLEAGSLHAGATYIYVACQMFTETSENFWTTAFELTENLDDSLVGSDILDTLSKVIPWSKENESFSHESSKTSCA